MCDPLTIAGAALGLGGTAANAIGQSQAASASNRAYEAERARQQNLQQEAAKVQAHSQSLFDNFAGQQAGRANDLTTFLKGAQLGAQGNAAVIEAPTSTAPTGGGGSSNVTTTGGSITEQGETAQRGKADAFAGQQAGALGQLRSFADMLGTDNRLQARDAGQIGQVGNFMRGSASVLPAELNAASHEGDMWKTLGGVAQGLGKVGVAAGTSGRGFESLLGGKADPGAISLPVFAGTGSLGSIASAYSGLPAAPMQLGTAFGAAPSFASSPYRT